MDRRKSLKLIATGAIATGVAAAGCNTEDKKPETAKPAEPTFALDRNPDELKREKELIAKGPFFTPHEMATITVLSDIIIPKDEVSGSASEAKVPEFIDFIVRDMPQHQVPLRGGLRWLDVESTKRYEKSFREADPAQQLALVDLIAYPEKAKKTKALTQGVAFFTLLRNLVATGFYTSEMGVKDLGYVGNKPNQWNGVPDDVLQQYKVSYTEKEMKECVTFDK